MKCLILAGGAGERLWPLSRHNYPKQFIELTSFHSVFQDTIARNMPYCDEFLIASGSEHKDIIADQLKAFQGLAVTRIFEDVPRRTTASVALTLMTLPPSEFVLVVPSDIMIDASSGYSEVILEAKRKASSGSIVVFGKEEETVNSRYGYICGTPVRFVEKPGDADSVEKPFYRNLGMMLVRAGDFLNELKNISPEIYGACEEAFAMRTTDGGDLRFTKEALERIERVSVERLVLENTSSLAMVNADIPWEELTSLEDLEKFSYRNKGPAVTFNSNGTFVVNKSDSRAVVVSGVHDAVVVNTDDAVFVGAKGRSSESDLKKILSSGSSESAKIESFINSGTIQFRQWGYYKQLERSADHYVRHVFVDPGKTIYEHSHEMRTENWIILKGKARVTLDSVTYDYEDCGNVEVLPQVKHQISNTGESVLEFIDTSYGKDIFTDDRQARTADDIGEIELGAKNETVLKLQPALKEYLWGGTRLKEEFGIDSDMEKIAEAWLLSAHPDGQSRIMNGRHKGMYLGTYIDTVGKQILGWKCSSLRAFPLLVKLIDAKADLSVQVHPGDDYALANESSYGKNEMWYVLDSAPGAGLYVGFKKDVTAEEVRSKIEDGTITELLNFVPTKKGDVFFIPAGTVHAIGAGNLICEVQQSSNCTYRLYDYDRVDRYGNKRPLHLDKGLEVTNLRKYEPQSFEDSDNVICRCKYFEALVYDVDGKLTAAADDSKFDTAVCLEGEGAVRCADTCMNLSKGESVFLPASKDLIEFTGRMKVLVCHV